MSSAIIKMELSPTPFGHKVLLNKLYNPTFTSKGTIIVFTFFSFLEKGSLGTTHHLTNVAKAEQGKGGNADQRLQNEVTQIKTSAEKFIDLLAKNDNPIAQKGLLDIHLYIIEKLEDQNFKNYIKGKTKANLKFFPTINNKEFDSISGDFHKYVSNFK